MVVLLVASIRRWGMSVCLEPLDVGHPNKTPALQSPFYSSLRRIFFLPPKTLTTQAQTQTQTQSVIHWRRWCSVSPTASGTAMPPSPTNTGSSKPLVIKSLPHWLCFGSEQFLFLFCLKKKFLVLIGSAGYVVFGSVGIMQVESSFIRLPRRGPADPSAPSLARGFRGCAFCYSFNFFFFFVV